MSKKAPAKKGAAPPPEPVPVVEEPPKPTPEELEALAKAAEERRIREHNVARVTFPKLPIKRIVSHHSSTILAAEAPVVVALTDVKENEVRIAFRHRAGERGYIVASEVAEVVAPLLHFRVEELGDERFAQNVARLRGLVLPFLPPAAQAPAPADPAVPSLPAAPAAEAAATVDGAVPPAEAPPAEPPLSEAAFVDVFARLFAPSFHYGQHLRLYAGRNCATEVRELLLRGCAINTANGEGLTALHFACEKDHVAVVDALLAAHVDGHPLLQLDLNAQDKHGWTPLHCAVHHGSAACVQRLLALRPQSAALAAFAGLRGVDVSLRTRVGHGALHVACAQNRGTFVQPLLDAGARFSDTDALGRTPLHLAAYHGHASLFAEYAAALGGKAPQLAADAEALTLPDALRFAPADYVAIDEAPKIFV